MRNILKVVGFIVLIATFYNCSKEYEVPQDLVVNDFVWKGLNAYYLHQDQIPDLADRRFSSDDEVNAYLATFPDYNTLFSSLLISSDVKSTLIEDYNNLNDTPLRSSFTNGLEFGIIAQPNNTENVIGYVTHILPNSNASTKNIIRGEFFNAVDGVQLTRTNYQDILINGLDNFTINIVNFDGTTITPTTKTVDLEKQSYNYSPTFLEKVITVNTDKIGYLNYNNDFSKNYIPNLNNTFLNFKNQSVNKLILDLRYNIGGGSFAKNVSQIASMINNQTPNEVAIKKQWNSKAQAWFLANQPDSLLMRFPSKLNETTDINSLNVSDIYIILNGDGFTGSSATELLINTLNTVMNVHVIGNNTAGNNTGSITLYNSEDYDFGTRNTSHTVALQPIVLSFLNNNDEAYENGFTPVLRLCTNENLLDLGVLGENSDPILNNILDFISTGNTATNACNLNNFEYIFKSINLQREVDKGVFINQNLPNTN
jgi:hypothetical protein